MSEKKKAVISFAVAAACILAGIILLEAYNANTDIDWLVYPVAPLFAVSVIPFVIGMWHTFHNKKSMVAFGISLGCGLVAVIMFCVAFSHPEVSGPMIIGYIFWAILILCVVSFVYGILTLFLDFKISIKRNKNDVE